jgi:alginate O-acetyltransferase complex protein AlgI
VLFVEYRFVFFFLLVFAGHWVLRPSWARKVWLLLASYAFYAAWDWRFLSLIWTSTIVDYLVGLRLRVEEREGLRRLLLAVSVVANLGLLGFFKYFGFFVDSAVEVLGWLGLDPGRPALQIVLPVGISFYTFQTMSYTIDGYRRVLTPTRNPLDVAVFVAFFPQLVAGPIVRAADFMPQLRRPRVFAEVAVRPALVLFLVGFVKKAVVADNAAVIADAYFADPVPGVAAFLGVGAYAAQIYGDFSGYSDMAIALAAMLGYRLPLNFNYPYLARNITDFWRRWHISLSTWLRDYLYVPLGGNRGSRLFTYRNLMLTMLIGGLWHGAAWRFVVWGGLHGLALVAHREWVRRRPEGLGIPRPVASVLATAGTLYWVCLAWIFFRAQDLATAWAATRSFLFLDGIGDPMLTAFDGRLAAGGMVAALVGLLAYHVAAHRGAFRRWDRLPGWAFSGLYGAAIPVVLAFVPVAAAPFIYFQF